VWALSYGMFKILTVFSTSSRNWSIKRLITP
jgi:hypothetical protein